MIDLKATIEEMRKSGLDDATIVAALACIREVPVDTRSSAAIRQQRYRDRNKASQTVTRDAEPSLPRQEGPHTPKETQPTLPTTHKEKTPKGVQKKASRLPADWVLPEEWRQDAIAAGVPARMIDAEAEKMRDWSLSSKAGAKLDWRAAWRNWCRAAAERSPQARGSPPMRMDDFLGTVIEQQERRNAGPDTEIEGAPQALRAIPGGRWSG